MINVVLSRFTIITYFAKKSNGKTYVNFLTNLNNITEKEVRNKYNKKLSKEVPVPFPSIIDLYNKGYNFVDKAKNALLRIVNKYKSKRRWRVKCNTILYGLLQNAYIYYKDTKNLGK